MMEGFQFNNVFPMSHCFKIRFVIAGKVLIRIFALWGFWLVYKRPITDTRTIHELYTSRLIPANTVDNLVLGFVK